MFLTNVQHLFCNSSTGTKTVFPHKIYLPKGDLPLENEIAVVMSKAFGHRKRKYEFNQYTDYVHWVHKLHDIWSVWKMNYDWDCNFDGICYLPQWKAFNSFQSRNVWLVQKQILNGFQSFAPSNCTNLHNLICK